MKLTAALLFAAIPGCDAAHWLEPAQLAADRHGITEPIEFAFWLAHAAHETKGLTRMEESFNYSAQRLAQVWPKRFRANGWNNPNKLACDLAKAGPEAIANFVYANRMGNGPPESGDGWRYRGRGWCMLTWRVNYESYRQLSSGAAARTRQIIEGEIIRSQDFDLWCADVGAWYWVKHLGRERTALLPGLDQPHMREAFIQDVRALNGGLIGIEDRLKRWKVSMRAFGFEM